MDQFDWNQARAFHAAALHGSFSAAAREIGLTQPTLSRQVAALEEKLDITLFERIGKQLLLTESGKELLSHVSLMRNAADNMALSASGQSQSVEGIVSISATDGVSIHFLPPILERIRKEAPGITIEIIVSNSISDLKRREADIAIRHVRPEEPELIGKLIRECEAKFYASREWISKNGMPKGPKNVANASFIGFDSDGRFERYMREIGLELNPKNIPLISENSMLVWELVKRGLGIGAMMCDIADETPNMVPILGDLPPIKFPIWLVTHRELHTSRKIRIVFDILAQEL